MVILLCLIFIGQSTASSTMFYKMTAMTAMGSMSHTSTMNINMHRDMVMSPIAHDEANNVSNSNCCKQECKCFASGCSAPSAFSKTFTSVALVTLPTKIYNHNEMILEQVLTSLFRPPILS